MAKAISNDFSVTVILTLTIYITMWSLLPITIGAVLVIQCGLNDQIQQKHGLIYAMFANNVVCISVTCLLVWLNYKSSLGEIDILKVQRPSFYLWWYLLPGLMGAIIVGGMALSFYKIGAVKTTIYIVSSQAVVSIFWDLVYKHKQITIEKGLAILLIIFGVYLISRD